MLVVDREQSIVPGGCNTDGTLDGLARARSRVQLAEAVPLPRALAEVYAQHVEVCATTLCNNSYANYIAIINRVLWNLQSNGTHIVGKYPVTRVCSLSHKRLHAETPHAQRDEEVELRFRRLQKRVDEATADAEMLATSVQSDEKCPVCHKRTIIERRTSQMRSADEGMKTRCMCPCGAFWSEE
jgi:DNA-directed RNA polymerase subunit M/transcription elongation factor TFIIS